MMTLSEDDPSVDLYYLDNYKQLVTDLLHPSTKTDEF